MTDDCYCWTSEDTFVWYIRGGELDGTYYRQHFPELVEGYDGEVVLWHWEDDEEETATGTSRRYPADMPPRLRRQLTVDEASFGTSFYETTEDGYRRLDPTTVICGPDGPPSGIELTTKPTRNPGDYYGTPQLQALDLDLDDDLVDLDGLAIGGLPGAVPSAELVDSSAVIPPVDTCPDCGERALAITDDGRLWPCGCDWSSG